MIAASKCSIVFTSTPLIPKVVLLSVETIYVISAGISKLSLSVLTKTIPLFSVAGFKVMLEKIPVCIPFPEKESNVQSISLLSELKNNFGSEIIKNKNISTNDSLIKALISQY